MKKTQKRLTIWAVVVAGILLIPFVTRAPWSAADYIFAGVVLFGAATIFEFVTKNIKEKMYKIAVGIAVLFVLMLIWAWAVAGP